MNRNLNIEYSDCEKLLNLVDVITLEVSSVGMPGEQLSRRHNESRLSKLESYLNSFRYSRVPGMISRATIWANLLFMKDELIK